MALFGLASLQPPATSRDFSGCASHYNSPARHLGQNSHQATVDCHFAGRLERYPKVRDWCNAGSCRQHTPYDPAREKLLKSS